MASSDEVRSHPHADLYIQLDTKISGFHRLRGIIFRNKIFSSKKFRKILFFGIFLRIDVALMR